MDGGDQIIPRARERGLIVRELDEETIVYETRDGPGTLPGPNVCYGLETLRRTNDGNGEPGRHPAANAAGPSR